MTLKKVENIVIESFEEIVELGDYETNGKIDKDTVPFSSIEGFDSLVAIELSVSIEGKLKREINLQTFGISCSKKHPEQLSIKEIAKNIYENIKE